uniref:Uncharacterized protein n=1 Tax=Nelumbo nucifera TaxID=4432 RepID=A0A822XTK7_NELNU|nr:TPA_asm: hypothetical protein HUJ06_024516 [Nelumbo nucifera]
MTSEIITARNFSCRFFIGIIISGALGIVTFSSGQPHHGVLSLQDVVRGMIKGALFTLLFVVFLDIAIVGVVSVSFIAGVTVFPGSFAFYDDFGTETFAGVQQLQVVPLSAAIERDAFVNEISANKEAVWEDVALLGFIGLVELALGR